MCSLGEIVIKAENPHTLLDTNAPLKFVDTSCIYILDIQHFFLFFISSNKFAEKGRAENTVIQSKVSYKEHGLCVRKTKETSASHLLSASSFLFPILCARGRFHPITSVPFCLLYFITL